MYHRFSDIVLRFGVGATMLARVPVVLPPLLRAATLLPLQCHLLRVNEFPVRERVEALPPPGRCLIRASPDHA